MPADPDLTDPSFFGPVAGVAVAVGLLLAPLGQRAARWAFPRAARATGVTFEWRDLAAVALVFIASQVLAGGIAAGFGLDLEAVLVALPLTALAQLITCAAILGLAAKRRHGFPALGLRRGEGAWSIAYGLVRYFGWWPFLFALMATAPFLVEVLFDVPYEPQEVAQLIAGATGAERLLVLALAALVIPFCEELIFRGFLQTALEARVGRVAAVALASLIFAALHGTAAFVPIFGLSVILGIVMLHTRRLLACWAIHGLHNGLTTGLLFLFPDMLGG